MGKKIAIVGAGNAGCISALQLYFLKEEEQGDVIGEIEIYHDPDLPIERVGQGLQLDTRTTVFDCLGMNWIDKNLINATIKQGINYEGWGKKNPNFFHAFGGGEVAAHYIPSLLSQETLKSGLFKVVEKNITDIDNQVDADYVIDCRGTPDVLDDKYEILRNPLNSVILAKEDGRDIDLLYTRHVATPNGWTFIIPNHDSVSYGYLYNSDITSRDDAEKDMIGRFGVEPDANLSFQNYVAKDIWADERTLLNGNRYSFIEPMEATASSVHADVAQSLYAMLIDEIFQSEVNPHMNKHVKRCQDFILWHYKTGSIYDTPFWKHASKLKYSKKKDIENYIESSKNAPRITPDVEDENDEDFGQWGPPSFKCWYDNTN